jgi:hypothetical protein
MAVWQLTTIGFLSVTLNHGRSILVLFLVLAFDGDHRGSL